MKKKGFMFYVVAILTILSAGFSTLTLKESLVGAAYYEYNAVDQIVEVETIATTTPVIASSTTSVTPTPTVKPKETPKVIANPTHPARLIIPSLSINAYVQQTGLTKTGAIGIPTNFKDVAWYNGGPVPGENGNAIVDGHVDNALGMPGVFKRLHEMKVGDDIYVKNKKGEDLHFIVSSVDSYHYESVPASVFGTADEPLLRLITCGGTWIPGKKTYDTRIIVTARLES